ncbi:MAG: group II intron reverse transcriptase/maturase [Anaerolineae bacterium]
MLNRLLSRWRTGPQPEELPGLFSREALERAWRAVRANKGGPGVDGISIRGFERDLDGHLTELQRELVSGTYKPRPVRRVLVPKPNGGLRPLAMWALRDRVAQRVVYEYLEPIFEPVFLDCSFGFRPGRSVAHAVERVRLHREANRRWVLDADIQDCFDRIDAGILMRLIRRRVRHKTVLRLIRGWLDAEIFNSIDGRPARAGASQGSVLSPMLCNIYLHEFDQRIIKQGYHLVRYADDLLILCRRRQQARQAYKDAGRALAGLRLELHPDKTQIVHFDEGFRFLGHFFLRNEIFRI